MKNKSKKGFTLIEMLIVVAIIGLLATVVLFAVARARKKAVATQMKAHTEEAMKALEMAATDGCTSLSFTAGSTTSTDVTGSTDGCPDGLTATYIKRVPEDPSGVATYDWNNGGEKTVDGYVLITAGFDGGATFRCEEGSCWCTSNGGCLSIP